MLTAPCWRDALSRPASNIPARRSRPCLSMPISLAAFEKAGFSRHDVFAQMRIFSSSTRSRQQTNLSTADQRSLIAVPVYETSPASLGIDGWFGYESMIAPSTSLPCTMSATLRSALDNISQETIKVCSYLPATRLRVDLAQLTLCDVRREKKEKSSMQAVMILRTDLTGRFTVRFTPENGGGTKKEASVDFDASQVLSRGDCHAVVSRQIDQGCPPSFLVVDGSSDIAWIRWQSVCSWLYVYHFAVINYLFSRFLAIAQLRPSLLYALRPAAPTESSPYSEDFPSIPTTQWASRRPATEFWRGLTCCEGSTGIVRTSSLVSLSLIGCKISLYSLFVSIFSGTLLEDIPQLGRAGHDGRSQESCGIREYFEIARGCHLGFAEEWRLIERGRDQWLTKFERAWRRWWSTLGR